MNKRDSKLIVFLLHTLSPTPPKHTVGREPYFVRCFPATSQLASRWKPWLQMLWSTVQWHYLELMSSSARFAQWPSSLGAKLYDNLGYKSQSFAQKLECHCIPSATCWCHFHFEAFAGRVSHHWQVDWNQGSTLQNQPVCFLWHSP